MPLLSSLSRQKSPSNGLVSLTHQGRSKKPAPSGDQKPMTSGPFSDGLSWNRTREIAAKSCAFK